MRNFTLEGIVKMHEEIIDRQKELRREKMYLRDVLHAYLITLEDGERFKIRNTYFHRDTKKRVGGTIRYVGGR
jgi:predicted transcriptional regulator